MLLEASQYGAVDEPTQLEPVPHLQTPLLHNSPPVHAEILAAHLHRLLAASQYGAVDDPTQLAAVPHLQTPLETSHVSPALLHVTPWHRLTVLNKGISL